MIIEDRIYSILKWIAQIFLPAVSALYFAISEIWGLPYATEIIGTIAAIDTFIGALLQISSKEYYGRKILDKVPEPKG